MRKKKWEKQFLAGMLCVGMVFQSFPIHAFAGEAFVSQPLQEETLETQSSQEEQAESQLLQEYLSEEQSESRTEQPPEEQTRVGETQESSESDTKDINETESENDCTDSQNSITESMDETETAKTEETLETEEETQQEEMNPLEEEPKGDSRITQTGTTLTLENNSVVTVEGITRDKGQWIEFTAPDDGIYRFGWDYDEDDYGDWTFCYMYSEIIEDLARIPEEPKPEDLKEPLLAYDCGYGFRLEHRMSKDDKVYLFVKLKNWDIPQTFPVYAKPVREAIDIFVGNTYEITDVNDDNAQWLVFQAADSGFYEIRSSDCHADTSREWEPHFDIYRQISGDYWGDDDGDTNFTFYAKEGQTRYIKARTMDDSDGSHVKGSYQITVTKLSDIAANITAGISKITVDLETESLGGISPTIYYKKTTDSAWNPIRTQVNASSRKAVDISGLEPDTEYLLEMRYGYYGEEEVILFKETVRTKSMDGSLEQQVGDYQVKWQTEPSYGGFTLAAQITKTNQNDTTDSNAEVFFYTQQGEGKWIKRTTENEKEIQLGGNKSWKISGLDFGDAYKIGISIKTSSSETTSSETTLPENEEITELTGEVVTVEMPESLKQVSSHAGCQYFVIENAKRDNELYFEQPSAVQDGKAYKLVYGGQRTTSGGELSSWYLPIYEEWSTEFKEFQSEKEFDVRMGIRKNNEYGYLVFKGQKLTQKPDPEELAKQLSANANGITYDLDSDKDPSLTVPVQIGDMPKDIHLVMVPALVTDNGGYTHYRTGKSYSAISDSHIDAQITGVDAGQTKRLAVCLFEDMFLGMVQPASYLMMYGRENPFAEITVMESYTIPNSNRTITLNDTTADAVKVQVNITVGNTLEGETLYAYAKYWPSADEGNVVRYTEDVILNSYNSYTGDIVFEDLASNTEYRYMIYLYREYETEDDRYDVNVEKDSSYTFTTKSADNIELKELFVQERYAGGADIFVSLSEKIESDKMLTIYYREKGQTEWQKYLRGFNDGEWENCCIIDEDGNATVMLKYLNSATEYEYYISFYGKSFSDGEVTDENSIYKSFRTRSMDEVVAGRAEIISQSDRASLTLNAVIPDRTVRATIHCEIKDNEAGHINYWREIQLNVFEECGDGVYRKTIDIPNLTPETTYEYEIKYYTHAYTVFGDAETGTFTTKKQGDDGPEFEIRPNDEKLTVAISEFIFNNAEQKAKPEITYDGRKLIESIDYDVFYTGTQDDYKSAGIHTFEVRFKGNYGGAITQNYTISPRTIEEGDSRLETVYPTLYFNAAEQKAKPEITYDGWKLVENVDYEVVYNRTGDDYSSVGTHTVEISFQGNYTGIIMQNYTIHPQSAENMGADLMVIVPSLYYNKKAQYPKPEVFYGDEKLVQGIDYQTEYPDKDGQGRTDDHKSVGVHTLKIIFMRNYEGSITRTYYLYDKKKASEENTVDLKSLKFSLNKTDIQNAYYTGRAVAPKVELKGADAKEGINYRVVYKNNYNAGKATITIIGLGSNVENVEGNSRNTVTYVGTKTLNFTIKKPNIKKDITANQYTDHYDYKGNPVTLEDLKLTLNKEDYVLKQGTDYTIAYKKNNTSGTATATVKGIGNFTGTTQYKFTVNPINLNDEETQRQMADAITGVEYSPKGAKLKMVSLGDMTLKEGTDYKAKYTYSDKKNKKAGSTVTITLTGKNACKGSVTFEDVLITEANLSSCICIPSDLVLDIANPNKSKSALKITDYTGVKLKKDKDYILEWDENESDALLGSELTLIIKPAEGSCYQGKKTVSYRISENLSKLKKVKVKNIMIFDGRNPVTLKPADIMYGDGETAFNADEIIILAYKNNTKAGTAQVTIQGTGRYFGQKTLKFKITD